MFDTIENRQTKSPWHNYLVPGASSFRVSPGAGFSSSRFYVP